MKEKISKARKTVKKKCQSVDPVLGWTMVVTGFLLSIGLIATGVINVTTSVAMRMEVPEKGMLKNEISRCRSELKNLEEDASGTTASGGTGGTIETEMEEKDDELRELEAKMAKINNGSYTRLKRGAIMANMVWFVGGGIILVLSIILLIWMKDNVRKEAKKGTK